MGSIQNHNSKSGNLSIRRNLIVDPVVAGISAVIPAIGDYGKGKASSYVLYNLRKENPGYDVIIYPQYETKKFIIPIFYSERAVKVTPRLGRKK